MNTYNIDKMYESYSNEVERMQKYIDELLQENKQLKEVIDKAIKKLEQGITFCQNDSQGVYDKCNIAIKREQNILDILKEVE